MAERAIVAGALATAFLAEKKWTRERLTARATDVLGERPPWLSKVVARLVAQYQDRPEGRQRELARFVFADPNLRAACASSHAPTIRIWPVARVEPWDSRWHVRPLSTAHDVATWLGVRVQELDWFADTHGLERHAANESLRHYRYRWISKRSDGSGGVRLLEAPKPRTKAIQRAILHEILDLIPAHDAAHGFRRGRSVRTHAAPHAGQAVVIRLDLADFFLSISAARVAAVFRSAGYPEEVAFVLACLCTNRAPAAALAHAHGPYATRDDIQAWWRARALARARHLPQGSPTSAFASLKEAPYFSWSQMKASQFSVRARANEKQRSRAADERALESGRKSRSRLRRENGCFAFRDVEFVIAELRSLA